VALPLRREIVLSSLIALIAVAPFRTAGTPVTASLPARVLWGYVERPYGLLWSSWPPRLGWSPWRSG